RFCVCVCVVFCCVSVFFLFFFFFSSRRRHTRFSRDWSSDVCFPILLARVFRCFTSSYLDPVSKSSGNSCSSNGDGQEQPESEPHQRFPSPSSKTSVKSKE